MTTTKINIKSRRGLEPEEFDRIFFGELTEADFSTESPNVYRLDKFAAGIYDYMKYKKKMYR